jgi:predicted metal-dependent peptidase
MGVTINPKGMEGLTQLERIAIMKHEAMHVIHRHWDRLVGVSNMMCRQTAEEISINQHIKNLPKKCLFPTTYDLQTGLSLEEYYTLLIAKQKEDPVGFKVNFDGNPLKGDADDIVEIDMQKAENLCNDAQQYEQAVGKDPGSMFEKIKKVPTNYIARIKTKVACQPSTTRLKFSNNRRSRRYKKSAGTKFELALGNGIFGIDTSGSMDEEELGKSIDCGNKVSHLVKDLWWIQCDSVVQNVDKKKNKNINEIEVHGRGGTDLQPIFEKAIEYGYPKVPLVIFTDGELWNWPTLKEMINSVWIITNEAAAENFHSKFPSVPYAVLL